MTIKKWDLKAEGSSLPMNPGFKGNVTQKRITTSFSLSGKEILLMISQISFCLNTERQKVQQHCHWLPLHPSWIKELPYLEQVYHFYT